MYHIVIDVTREEIFVTVVIRFTAETFFQGKREGTMQVSFSGSGQSPGAPVSAMEINRPQTQVACQTGSSIESPPQRERGTASFSN
jgi:hypothetical protein